MSSSMTRVEDQGSHMKAGTQGVESAPSPEERLNVRARVMSELAQLTTEEIETAMASLHRMTDESKKRDELLAKLLVPGISYAEARQIAAASFTSTHSSVSRGEREPESVSEPIRLSTTSSDA